MRNAAWAATAILMFGCAQGAPGEAAVDVAATAPQQPVPDAGPADAGVVASNGSYILPPPAYDFLAHDGDLRAAQKGGALYAGPDSAVIVRPADGQLIAESFAADGTSKRTTAIAAVTPAGLMLDGAMSTTGATLVVWQIYGEATATARWLSADGSASSAPFSIAGWSSSAPQTAALAGGAIAIAAEPT